MTTIDRPTAGDFRARQRAAGLFTEVLSQRLGAWFAVLAHRGGIPPTALTMVNLVLGLAAGLLVIVAALPDPAGGLLALLLWQVAYGFDCADGQLARVTGRTSVAGQRIDILCDVALQIMLVAAVSSVAARHDPRPAAWLVAAFAGTWMVNLITSVLQQGATAASLVTSTSTLVRVVKLVRDYGAVITVIGLVIAFAPQWTFWLVVGFTVINGLFLLASIAATARASLRAA